MVYFKEIKATKHYGEHHEKYVPWHKVIEILLSTKNPRKNGDVFEIEADGYYIVFKIEQKVVYVINAKKG